ncbi:MAG TPA: helix-turn-helix domain-containing protein [Gammaproteobacteria bacterium]|nr:helix-turn-helix domain-containing protein [Gammaproteobacteria bacterium]
MVRFPVWRTTGESQFSHSIDAWTHDPDLQRSFGARFRIRPTYVQGARMFYRAVSMGDLSISATAASSPLIHDCLADLCDDHGRRMFLLMPNQPRWVEGGGRRFVQQPGECAFTDSAVDHAASYKSPHAAICLSIPFGTLRHYLPEPQRLVGLRFASSGALSRLASMLLLSIWSSAEDGTAASDGLRAAHALLGVIARCHGNAAALDAEGDTCGRVRCAQVKQLINAEIRNPALCVQFVAERIGVTTRYLQLLFSAEGECVSHYIKRERLLGCLLDLRDSDFDNQSITEIAFSWGFNSAAHFSSSFKREFGLNPRDYRSCDLEELASLQPIGVEDSLLQALILLDRTSVRAGARESSTPRSGRPTQLQA